MTLEGRCLKEWHDSPAEFYVIIMHDNIFVTSQTAIVCYLERAHPHVSRAMNIVPYCELYVIFPVRKFTQRVAGPYINV